MFRCNGSNYQIPIELVLYEETYTSFPWVNDTYLETSYVYSNLKELENYDIVTEVRHHHNTWNITIHSFTYMICQYFPHPSFSMFDIIVFLIIGFFSCHSLLLSENLFVDWFWHLHSSTQIVGNLFTLCNTCVGISTRKLVSMYCPIYF